MPATSTDLLKGPRKPIAEPRHLDSSSVHFSLHSNFLSSLLLPSFQKNPSLCSPLHSAVQSNFDIALRSTSLQRPFQFPLHSSSLSGSLTAPLCNALSTPLSSLYSTLHCSSTSLATTFHRTFPSHLSCLRCPTYILFRNMTY